MPNRDLAAEEQRKADRLQIAATVVVFLFLAVSLFLWDSIWLPIVGIPAGILLWALVLKRNRILRKARPRRTRLRILAFVVWFALVIGLGFVVPEPLVWPTVIVSVAVLLVIARAITQLEDRGAE